MPLYEDVSLNDNLVYSLFQFFKKPYANFSIQTSIAYASFSMQTSIGGQFI